MGERSPIWWGEKSDRLFCLVSCMADVTTETLGVVNPSSVENNSHLVTED